VVALCDFQVECPSTGGVAPRDIACLPAQFTELCPPRRALSMAETPPTSGDPDDVPRDELGSCGTWSGCTSTDDISQAAVMRLFPDAAADPHSLALFTVDRTGRSTMYTLVLEIGGND
jgi:hypothetical protein